MSVIWLHGEPPVTADVDLSPDAETCLRPHFFGGVRRGAGNVGVVPVPPQGAVAEVERRAGSPAALLDPVHIHAGVLDRVGYPGERSLALGVERQPGVVGPRATRGAVQERSARPGEPAARRAPPRPSIVDVPGDRQVLGRRQYLTLQVRR